MQGEQIILHTGSNLGERLGNLKIANQLIEQRVGKISCASRFYETAAWGITKQAKFINQALLLQTDLSPEKLLTTILDIENEMGRKRLQKWGTRLIDIDILFYNDWIINEQNLIIPHPYLQERNFVLTPLLDIIPDFIHPIFNLSIRELSEQCTDKLPVIPISSHSRL